MPALSERKIEIVRMLVATAPDRVVGNLQQALAETAEGSALGGVRRLVEVEVFERTLRNAILQPIVPMCVGAGDNPRLLTFPSRALTQIWRGLRETEDAAIEHARKLSEDDAPLQVLLASLDRLTAAAAAGLRARDSGPFEAAAEVCDVARPGGAALLASCLDLAPVVRRATSKLSEWIAHPGGETSASARLAYKDAVEVAEDAGPRFFQMLAAQMAQPWMVLRVISAVMDKPTERYLADSELGGFGENVMADIDSALGSIAGLRADGGPAAAREVAKLADLVIHQVLEVETSVALEKEHGWGLRVHRQRSGLASVVEGRLKEAEKAVMEALPMHAPRHQRIRRQIPLLNVAPEPLPVGRALTLLSFSHELRTTANYGGFSSTRAKMVEKLSEYLIHYVEEVLDLIRTNEVDDVEIAAAFLETAAEFSDLLTGEKTGELVRRRAHAAIHPEHHLDTGT